MAFIADVRETRPRPIGKSVLGEWPRMAKSLSTRGAFVPQRLVSLSNLGGCDRSSGRVANVRKARKS